MVWQDSPASSTVMSPIMVQRPTVSPPPTQDTKSTNSTPLSYSSIANGSNTGGINWTAQKAPVTGDTVYTGEVNGQRVYVGPDNQLWTGGAGNFYGSWGQAGAQINPIIGAGGATAATWASLFPNTSTSNTVYESTYTGPGADSQAKNDAGYSNVATQLPTETVVPNAGGTITAPSGSATSQEPGATSGPTPGTVVVSGAQNPPAGTSSGTSSSATGSSSSATGSSSSTQPDAAQQLIDSALEILKEQQAAMQQYQGVPGAGSIASELPVPQATTSSSSGPPSGVIIAALLAAAGLVGFYLWRKHKSKGHAAESE